MNQKLKQAGLFAILAVFTISLTTGFVGEADARGVEVESESTRSSEAPGHSGAKAAGQTPEQSTRGVQAQEAEPVSLSLKQMELRDETGNLATESTKGFVSRADDYGLETFRAIYTIVNEGDGNVKNIEILVTSDTETVSVELQGNLDPKHSTITAMIKAVDPASINAEIVEFEI